jgi:hypothetical protein
MRRFVFFGLVVAALAVASLGLVSSASAANLPWLLPGGLEGAGIDKIDATSGVTLLQTLDRHLVECTSDTAETLNLKRNPAEGLLHIHFSGCKERELGTTCTGMTPEDREGHILALGKFKIVHDGKTEAELEYAVLFELEGEVLFLCDFGLIKIDVLGSVLCLILKPTELAFKHEIHCKNSGTEGDPQEVKWWFENTNGNASLLTSINGAAEQSSAEEGLATLTCLEAGVERRCELMG